MKEKILDSIKNEGGLLQSEVWKKFDVDSKKASRLAKNLEEDGLIKRESVVANGSRTYRLKYTGDEKSPFDSLFQNDTLVPCIKCSEECRPARCPEISKWILVKNNK